MGIGTGIQATGGRCCWLISHTWAVCPADTQCFRRPPGSAEGWATVSDTPDWLCLPLAPDFILGSSKE